MTVLAHDLFAGNAVTPPVERDLASVIVDSLGAA